MDLARNLIQRINVGDSLARSAAARPEHLAVADGPRRWTYAQFNGWVNQLAHGLAGRGYGRGDALGLASGNSAEFLAVYYACAKLGLVCVPINLGWRPEEVAYVLDHSGARGLVAESQLVAHVRDAVAKVAAIADVFVAPGTGAAYGAEPPTGHGPPWTTWRPPDPRRNRTPSWTTGTRSATCTPRAPRPSRRAWWARTWRSTWSPCPARWTSGPNDA